MKKLSGELQQQITQWVLYDEKARIAHRTVEVQKIWKEAVEHLYKDNAVYILNHVNAVYIKEEQGKKALIVYMDDSNYRSDIHNQQHFLLLWIKENYQEDIEIFKTISSRFGMKERYPYKESCYSLQAQTPSFSVREVELDAEEKEMIEQQAKRIENTTVRAAFEHAMQADKKWKKSISE